MIEICPENIIFGKSPPLLRNNTEQHTLRMIRIAESERITKARLKPGPPQIQRCKWISW